MDDDEPDPNRRSMIGTLFLIPVAGGMGEVIRWLARRHGSRQAAQIPARAFIEHRQERQLPVDTIAQAASDRQDGDR